MRHVDGSVVLGAAARFAAFAACMSCGGSEPAGDAAPRIVTPLAQLCAGAPPEDENHIVTAMSCPFIQHTENVVHFGVALGEPTDLRDAKGSAVARITHTCDSWALGADAQGVTVIIRRDTGEVVSHGLEHPGQPISALGSQVDAPLTTP